VAYALARTPSRRVRSALLVLTIAPFFTGAIVRTYAWVLVLGNTVLTWPVPMLFTERGVLVGLVHFSMPTMILILASALSHIDPAYERAAASLGAPPARVFWRVTLPLSMPGIVSGSLIVFAWTLSAFPTPEMLGGGKVKMIANVVRDLALDSFNWPGGAAFALMALVITLALGLVTPPVGVCLYAATAVSGLTLETLINNTVPWLIVTAATLLLFIIFPWIITGPIAWFF